MLGSTIPASRNVPQHAYIRLIQEIPSLSLDEETALARRVQRGDWEARARLVCAHLRLVPILARAKVGKGLDLDDLIAEGNLGLLRAAETFHPEHNTRFGTYAAYWIRAAIRRALAQYGRVVRLPTYVVRLLARWRQVTTRLQGELARPPSEEEIIGRLRLPAKKVRLIKKALRLASSNRQEVVREVAGSSLGNLRDPSSPSPVSFMIDAEDRDRARAGLAQLGRREARVLHLRYGLDTDAPKTLRETARCLGISKEGVRQIEQQALRKIARTMDLPERAPPASPPCSK
jgi:RNA polymerase primary sigma factor